MACGLALLGAVTGSLSAWLPQVFSSEDERLATAPVPDERPAAPPVNRERPPES